MYYFFLFIENLNVEHNDKIDKNNFKMGKDTLFYCMEFHVICT